jgi:predicted dehydrogenase
MLQRTRYVLAGVGNRGLGFFAEPLRREFAEHGELIGLFDISPARLAGVNRMWGMDLPVYTDFQAMLRALDPDAVIIATSDVSHADYVVQTLEAGKRVICEKPLAVTADQVRRILQAADRAAHHRSGPGLVTHNMRYESSVGELKALIDSGAIGQILHVTFQENLDRHHGADYFRRWHRFKANSGGLLIQKGSHHFDVLNWLIGSRPRRVIARGGLHVYGLRGPFRSARCTGCPFATQCAYYADLAAWAGDDAGRQLYTAAEGDSGYVRDACVFDERIDIEDQLDVLYDYENGVEVAYSLTAFASIESVRVEVEGTGGRVVLESIYPTDWPPGNYVVPGLETFQTSRLTLYSFRDGVKELATDAWLDEWETDRLTLLPELFGRPLAAPLTDRQATLEDGAWAVLIGIAANQSLENDSRPVEVRSLLEEH